MKNLPWYLLAATAATFGVVMLGKKSHRATGLPSIKDPLVKGKIEGAIATLSSPAELRQLASGLRKDGGLVEALKAEEKATVLEKAMAAVAATQAALPGPTAAQITASIPPPAPGQKRRAVIKAGMVGDDVKAWQAVIHVTQDGKFGPNTEAATKQWQSAHGMKPDGLVTPLSWIKART